MAKVLIMIVSGPAEPSKVRAGLGFAVVAKESQKVDDVRVCFFADGVEVLTADNVTPYEKLLGKIQEQESLTFACQRHAEIKGIESEVRGNPFGIDLHYVGDDLIDALNEGYEFITF